MLLLLLEGLQGEGESIVDKGRVASYALLKVLRTVGEAVAQVLASPVVELPQAMGREAVCNESFGRFVLVVFCVTEGVALVATAIILWAAVAVAVVAVVEGDDDGDCE